MVYSIASHHIAQHIKSCKTVCPHMPSSSTSNAELGVTLIAGMPHPSTIGTRTERLLQPLENRPATVVEEHSLLAHAARYGKKDRVERQKKWRGKNWKKKTFL
jgi:hypothetical protein